MILLQRLCWNTNGWRAPTGDMFGKEDSYVGREGFGHEEWNLNTTDLLNGRAFGYTYYSPPEGSELIGKGHDIYFFAISPSKERKLIGYYRDARFLDAKERDELKRAFTKSDLLEKRSEELMALRIPAIANARDARRLVLDQFSANIVVSPQDIHAVSGEPVLSKEMLGGRDPKYFTRYTKPVFLDRAPSLRGRNLIARPARVPTDQELLEDAYVRFTKPQQRVISRLHNQLSNRFRKWLREIGTREIAAESAFIDVQCVYGGKRHLFELKTCSQHLSPRHAIREAIGQLFEYSYFPQRRAPHFAAIVLDAEPSRDELLWCRAMVTNGIRIELFWLKGEDVYCADMAEHPLAGFARRSAD